MENLNQKQIYKKNNMITTVKPIPMEMPEAYKEAFKASEECCEQFLCQYLPKDTKVLGAGLLVPSLSGSMKKSPEEEFIDHNVQIELDVADDKKSLGRMVTCAIAWKKDELVHDFQIYDLCKTLQMYLLTEMMNRLELVKEDTKEAYYVRALPEFLYSKLPGKECVWLSLVCGIEQLK